MVSVGDRFGRWTVVADNGESVRGNRVLVCRCRCGLEKDVWRCHLVAGRSKGCGPCARSRARLSHGHARGKRSPEYLAWRAMRARCQRLSDRNFENYGGRGITVCAPWGDFANFLADMGPRPSAEHSLDRIDVNGNYEPGNCRWAVASIQNHNKRPQSNTGVLGIHRRKRGGFSWSVCRDGKTLCGQVAVMAEAKRLRAKAAHALYGEEFA